MRLIPLFLFVYLLSISCSIDRRHIKIEQFRIELRETMKRNREEFENIHAEEIRQLTKNTMPYQTLPGGMTIATLDSIIDEAARKVDEKR